MEGDRASVVLQGGVGRKCCARTASKNNLFSCAVFAFSAPVGAQSCPLRADPAPSLAWGCPGAVGLGKAGCQPSPVSPRCHRRELSRLHHVCWPWPAAFRVSSFAGGFERIPCQTGCVARTAQQGQVDAFIWSWYLHRASGQFVLETISCRCTDRGY